MKVTVKNLGILKQAEFEVGDLTIICGANNTGKTYATYALYGFLDFWNGNFTPVLLKKDEIEELFINGSTKIELDDLKTRAIEIVDRACKEYPARLPSVFAVSDSYFKSPSITISLDSSELREPENYNVNYSLRGKPLFKISQKKEESFLSISITAQAEDMEKIDREWLTPHVNRRILNVVLENIFTTPFFASTERTGAAIFLKELDYARTRLLEQMNNEKETSPKIDTRYALPVARDIDFVRDLENTSKFESVIALNDPVILNSFRDILGGEYMATRTGLYFIPTKHRVRLRMGESSSSVRSLLDVGFYIRHLAEPGDILMIDEPELNLHPANQRRMARLLARLVNAGVRVFITTHSDYILKEFNTLIMLKRGGAAAERVMKEYGYDKKELLDAAKIRAYIAQEAPLKAEGKARTRKYHTFVPAPIDEHGIEVESFDETINLMNLIQEELIFGNH